MTLQFWEWRIQIEFASPVHDRWLLLSLELHDDPNSEWERISEIGDWDAMYDPDTLEAFCKEVHLEFELLRR